MPFVVPTRMLLSAKLYWCCTTMALMLLGVKSFSVWGAWNQKPKVDALVAELTTAIQTRTDFDFAEYLDDWKLQDEHFDFRIFSEHHFPRPVS